MPHRSRKLPGKLIPRYDRAPDLDMPGASGDGPYEPCDGALSRPARVTWPVALAGAGLDGPSPNPGSYVRAAWDIRETVA